MTEAGPHGAAPSHLDAPVDYRVAGGVGRITLNAPETRNVLNLSSLEALAGALHRSAADDAVRVVVLTSVGRAFCAGADLSGDQGFAQDGPERYVAVLRALVEHPKPVVARVGGHVAGGGNGLIAAADIAVATESVKLAFSEVRVGVVPAVVAVVSLPRLSSRAAAELFLTGERITASRAQQIGLLNRVVADELALDEAVDGYVDALRLGAPGALSTTKEILRGIPQMSREAGFEWARDISAAAFSSPEAKEGMTAFMQRRTPAWAELSPS
jgi:methylglutaconyl-CoA hydratase